MENQPSQDFKAEEQQERAKDIEDREEEIQREDDQEDEETECGFCLFMKGGGCKDAFIAWEKCVEEADKDKEDVVERCFEVTSLLKKCMDAHADYYEPILRAEKAMEEEATREIDRESEREPSSPSPEMHPTIPAVAQDSPEVPPLPREEN